jgi:hypothetical protein
MDLLSAEQHQISKRIHLHVIQFPENDSGTEQLLGTIYDYMAGFKVILDSADKIQLDMLFNQYPGVYRFAKLLEGLAQGIASGKIDIPQN